MRLAIVQLALWLPKAQRFCLPIVLSRVVVHMKAVMRMLQCAVHRLPVCVLAQAAAYTKQ